MEPILLSFLLFFPLLSGMLLAALPSKYAAFYKWLNAGVAAINLVVCIYIYTQFDRHNAGYQFVTQLPWIKLDLNALGTLNIQYIVGVDGLSLPMVLLAGIVFLVGSIASFSIKEKQKSYYAFFLLLTTSVYGCFLSLDFFLFFLFFEFMLLPMYFLIGIWGGERREYASMKFIIYTLVGSVLILVVMLALGLSVKDHTLSQLLGKNAYTFDFRILANVKNYAVDAYLSTVSKAYVFGWPIRQVMFILLLIGFGIKLPMVPFHTWLPDAHVEAPTAISVILAGILLKVGAYGFLRVAVGFFPTEAQHFAQLIAILGVVSIIYGALNALAQQDLKKLVAYSSVSHMGFVFLGIAALNNEGINGAVFQMFSHGILSAMLFLITGVIYDRTHNRNIQNYRGLASKMPLFTAAVVVAFFGSLGLPGISGFIGEFFSLLGAFKSPVIAKIIPALATLGIVLSAIYLLWTMQRMFFGQFWVNRDLAGEMKDLSIREQVLLFSLAILAIVFGIFPNIIFEVSNFSIQVFTAGFQ